MCPACCRGAWPRALMGSVDRGLIMPARSQCPNDENRSVSIRRLTDDAITRVHPRKFSVPAGLSCSARRRQGTEVFLAHHAREAGIHDLLCWRLQEAVDARARPSAAPGMTGK